MNRPIPANLSVQEQAERLRTTLFSIGDAVITTDASGREHGQREIQLSLAGRTSLEFLQLGLGDFIDL
ncbi:MAG: hypothetical protein ACLQGP_24745 [Isosphaeraceae bacterium]